MTPTPKLPASAQRSLACAAAAYVLLGRPEPETLPDLAERLIDAGHCSPAVLTLWEANEPSWSDLREPFLMVLRELGCMLPSPKAAILTLIRQAMQDIVQGVVSPRNGVHIICALPFCAREEDLFKNLADADMFGVDDEYDRLRWESEQDRWPAQRTELMLQSIDRTVLRLAREWLDRHPGDTSA